MPPTEIFLSTPPEFESLIQSYPQPLPYVQARLGSAGQWHYGSANDIVSIFARLAEKLEVKIHGPLEVLLELRPQFGDLIELEEHQAQMARTIQAEIDTSCDELG